MYLYSQFISDTYLSTYLFSLGLVFYFFVFICGLILGSFLNSWIWRTRDNVRFISGRSQCVWCGRKLTWWENVPLVSFLALKGRCRTCRKPIPRHYLAVELCSALLLSLVAWQYVRLPLFNAWELWRDVFFLTILIVIFVYDSLYHLILSRLIWSGVVIGGLINYLFLRFTLGDMALGALLAGGFFLFQFLLSRGRWIGGGDVRFGIMMGVWLGWKSTLVALFVSYVLGAVVALVLLATKRRGWGSEIPFGAFLSIGTFLALYYGEAAIAWYINLISW